MSLTNIPEKIVSGDTVKFSVSNGVILEKYEMTYPQLTISFRSSGGVVQETEKLEPNTGDYEFNFKATAWSRGQVNWVAYLFEGDNRFTIGNGKLLVLQDPTNPNESLSHAQKVLNAIEASLEGTASNAQMMMSINGRMIQRYSISELLKFRGLYKREVSQEQKAMGYGNKDNIKIRFNNSSWGTR